MESQPEPKEARDPRSVMLAIMLAAIVVSVGAIGYVLYTNSQAQGLESSRAIAIGDTVLLNYTGRLVDGRVFDTSILEVALNDALYPKSLTFSLRSNDSYEVFKMEAGKVGSGGTIKGFAMGVLGLHVNDHTVIVVQRDEGYPVNTSMIRTVPVLEDVPVIEIFTEEDFRSYFGVEPVPMRSYEHFFWKWDTTVVEKIGGMVRVRNEPFVNQVVYPYGDPTDSTDPSGWACVVESYDPAAYDGLGVIKVRNILSSSDVYYVKGVDVNGKTFVVSGFNETAGTFEIHASDPDTGYNAELAGRVLEFEVTIENVVPATL